VRKELETKRLMLNAGTQNMIDCERKLYHSEQALEKAQCQITKLQLRVDELQMKYEPGKVFQEVNVHCVSFNSYLLTFEEVYWNAIV